MMRARETTNVHFVRTLLLSFIAVGINYGISFLLTPYISEEMGVEAYGFVSLAKTFANYASIFTIIINSFAARYITVEYHKGDYKKANQYFSTVFCADVFIGIVILVVAIVVIIFLERFLAIPADIVLDVKILFLLSVVNFLVVSCGTVFQAASMIKNRLDRSSINKCISYFIECLFLLLAFRFFNAKLYFVGCALILSSVSLILLNYDMTRRLTPQLHVSTKDFSRSDFIFILKNGLWNSVNSLGNTLNTGLDLLVTNLMLTPQVMGQLAIVKTITTMFNALNQLVAQPFQPLQLKYYAKHEREQLVRSFKSGIKFCGMISSIVFAGFVAYGELYYKLWTPGQDIELLYAVTVIAILAAVIEGAVYPLYYVYTLTLKNRIPCLVTIASGVLNVVGMIILIEAFDGGIFVVVGTTAVLMWIVNFVFTPIYAAHCIGERITVFFPVLIKQIASCGVMVVLFRKVFDAVAPTGWGGLIFGAMLSSVIGILCQGLIVCDKKDIKTILRFIKAHTA